MLAFKINNKSLKVLSTLRLSSTLSQNDEISPVLTNRNPRNLERLRIAYKPDGYHLEKPGKCFWHKLHLTASKRHVTARIEHFVNGQVLEASTKEWAIKKHLYRTTDISAYKNLGRILAQRCLEAGLMEVRCDISSTNEGRIHEFLKAVQEGGVSLKEPHQYKPARPWDGDRPEKPWEVTE